MNLQEHLVKGSSDSMKGNSSLNVTNLPDLVVIGIVVVEVICFLIYDVNTFSDNC